MDAQRKKYDRQLRIWGVEGQTRLMQANVCLLNCGPTGTEALKNLVLPGIGAFTVVDSNVVTEFDLTNNFFLDRAHLGQSRAETCKELLCELNSDVRGTAHVRDPVELIQKDTGFFLRFSLVIATQVDERNLMLLGDICLKLNLPLIVARTYGLMGALRVYSAEHFCYNVDPYPQPDLRVHAPFPALSALCEEVTEFTPHVPYVVILCQQLAIWRAKHINLPTSAAEKVAFKAQIKALSRQEDGLEENLEEAIKFAYLAFGGQQQQHNALRAQLQDLFQDDKCLRVNMGSEKNWILTRALKDFYETWQALPLSGVIPDMTSTTQLFVKVQQAYNEQSRLDFDRFNALVDAHLTKLGKHAAAEISREERATFCRFAATQTCLRYRTLREEFTAPQAGDIYVEEELHPMVFYVIWRACDEAFAECGKYPGSEVNASAKALRDEALHLHARALAVYDKYFAASSTFSREHVSLRCCEEMVRYGGVEMHNLAAIMGGIAAQEAVKLITHQYEPLNHTYFFNGITARGENWAL